LTDADGAKVIVWNGGVMTIYAMMKIYAMMSTCLNDEMSLIDEILTIVTDSSNAMACS
jgi:hypothetical protein